MKLNINNPFFRAMSLLADVVVLSVLWIVCSLPVVTAGAATLALFPAALGLLLPDVFFYLLPVFVLCGPGGCALGLALAVRLAFARMEEERGA